MEMARDIKYAVGLLLTILLLGSCKDSDTLGPDPYAGGKESLGIRFADELPYPSQGRPGDLMTFKVIGIDKYKDRLQFLINNTEAVIESYTDSSITAVLPDNVSTGGTSLVVDGQIFPGPICQIIGKISIDATFSSGSGTNGPLMTIKRLENGQIFLGGNFTDYNGFSASTDISGIVRITENGEFVKGMSFGKGVVGGSVNEIHALSGGGAILVGDILNYDDVKLMNNITRIDAGGRLATVPMEILNLTSDPANSTLVAPIFNGGTGTPPVKTFFHGNKLTAIGNFRRYIDRFYARSTYDNILTGFFGANGVVRMNLDGSLDSTFNLNHSVVPKISNMGVEGVLEGGIMQEGGKLIAVGELSRYNGVAVKGNIVRIDVDGKIDGSFNSGAGADGAIQGIYDTGQDGGAFLLGRFNSYNAVAAKNMVLINEDGTVDNSFKSQGFTGGIPSYVKLLSNGLILVTGTFKKYGEVLREGMCILNPDGTLAADYNNTGKLDGIVMDAVEGRNSLGQKTITLVGNISRFNGKSNIGNIMRLTIQD